MLQNYNENIEDKAWDFDDNGNLRITIRILKTGCMTYGREEFPVPDSYPVKETYELYVGPEAMGDPESMRSLEGMPITSWNHQWTGPAEQGWQSVGNIAGAPRVDGPYLAVDAIINDADAIASVVNRELQDTSSAYIFVPLWETGVKDCGPYDGEQTQLRYNHVTLLPPGEGRAGRDVRIMNANKKKEKPTMPTDLVQYGLPSGQTVRVVNSDVGTIANLAKDSTELATLKVTNADMAGSLETAMAEVERLNGEMETMGQERDKYMGEITAMQEKMTAMMDPVAMEDEAMNMMEEREESANMMMENGDYKDKEEAMNSLKPFRGHTLRAHVVKAIRAKNSLPELTKEQEESEGFVSGVFETYKATNAKPAAKTNVVGANVIQARNSGRQDGKRTALNKLGYKTKKES